MDRSEGEKPGAAERTCFESESKGSRASRSRRSVTTEARSDTLTLIYCLLKISFQYIGGIVYV